MERVSFYVRAKPDYLKAIEKYYYASEISRNPESRQNKNPEGLISYLMPFDGETFFSRTSLEDFNRQRRADSSAGTIGRVGSLVLENYSRTDMETRYDLVGNYGSLGINVPLRNETLIQDTDLVADRFQALGAYEYIPNPPELNPVNIRVLVFDEDSFKEKLDLTKIPSGAGDGNTLTDKVAKELVMQQGFKPALIFLFEISLALPTYAGELISRTSIEPTLQFLSLEWPFPTGQTNVALDIKDSEARHKLIYDPHQASIEWGGVKFHKGERREGVDAFTYTLPIAILEIRQPGELYRRQTLRGALTIELPILLSGLDIKAFNALGETENMPYVAKKTEIEVEFELYPEDCFANKTYAPYQHIQFEGLILEEMRVADIVKALQDRGFEIYRTAKHMEASDPTILRACTILAGRAEGPNQIDLWLQAEGTVSEVERMRERYGAERFTARVRTGQTVIYMRAELTGNGTRLTQILNEIQLLLKERLNRFIKLD